MNPKFNFRIILCAFILGLQGLINLNLSAQNCPNANFGMGDFTNWMGFTGTCCPIVLPTTGIVPGRQTIMSGAGTDPYTFGLLPVVAPGYTFSARLGNDLGGHEAEGLTYPLTVDPSNALFILKFAVVLQEPGHLPNEQPRFEIQVKDQFGNIIPCTEYLIAAAGSIPGFQTGVGDHIYRNWTTLGIDLTAYIGQPVTIEARSGDCTFTAHHGYGYLVGECQPLQIDVQYCPGDTSAILTAPDGFEHYQWSSGDTNQTITVNDPDSVNYNCVITSFNGCTASLNTVVQPIFIAAGFTVTPPCESTFFTDTSYINIGSIATWHWDFGDGNSSTVQNPGHQYNSPGNYNVQLVSLTSAGCGDTIVMPIVVEEDPTADFVLPTNCGSNVIFTDSSFIPGHTIVDWNWTFGTGDTLTTQNPNYFFPNDSTWPVQLIAYDERGCFDTITIPFTNNPYPVADFNFQNLCEGNISNFLDSSYVNITTVNGWTWNFSGLGNSTVQNPSFTFPGDGTYNISLIASTTGGCTDTITQTVTVYPLPAPDFTSTAVCEGFTTTFTNTSTIPSDSISIYTWHFGSGSVPGSANEDPTAVYPGDGVYLVTLITTSNQNCIDSVTIPVTVWPNPNISFTGSPLQGCAPLTVNFNNGTTVPVGTVTSYGWTFEGGGTSTNTNPSNLFPTTPGDYDVTLYAISSQGCDTSITLPDYITVNPDPSVNLGVDDSLCENSSMILDAGSGLTSYLWSTGATTSSINLNGTEGGTYSVGVVNSFGCTDADTIFIKDLLLPIFNIDDMIICEGDTGHIFIPDTSTQTFQWSTAGMPLFSTDNEVFITQAGTYYVTVTNFCGPVSDTSVVQFVPDLQNLQMPNILTVNGDGLNDLYEIPALIDAIEFKLSIFDRWGVLLFESTDMNVLWNGTSGSTTVPQGTYFGVLSYINCQGQEKQMTQAIMIF
jgi:gliding motility-associated-like protein